MADTLKIVVLPVRNEERMLPAFLDNVAAWADHVVMADQGSLDATREIARAHPLVSLVENPSNDFTSAVRGLLLQSARRQFGYGHLIIGIDADEALAPPAVEELGAIAADASPGCGFAAPWYQLWGSPRERRVDGAWAGSVKPFAFIDDGRVSYPSESVVNDHAPRIPSVADCVVLDGPLLHFQYLDSVAFAQKQSWYMLREYDAGSSALRVRRKYHESIRSHGIRAAPVPEEALLGVHIPPVGGRVDWRDADIREALGNSAGGLRVIKRALIDADTASAVGVAPGLSGSVARLCLDGAVGTLAAASGFRARLRRR